MATACLAAGPMLIYQPGLPLPFHLGMPITPKAAVTQLGKLIKDALRIAFSAALSLIRSRTCTAFGAAGSHCTALAGISPPTCSFVRCALRAARSPCEANQPANLFNLSHTRPLFTAAGFLPTLGDPWGSDPGGGLGHASSLDRSVSNLARPRASSGMYPPANVTGSVDVSFRRLRPSAGGHPGYFPPANLACCDALPCVTVVSGRRLVPVG
ncbi:hypothetical protein FKM82_000616 [Ascaphus truei]